MQPDSPRCLEINRKCSSRILYGDDPGSSRSSVGDMLRRSTSSALQPPPSTELVPFPAGPTAPTEESTTSAEPEEHPSGCSCFLWWPAKPFWLQPASSDDPAWVTSTAAAEPPPPPPQPSKRRAVETKQGLLQDEAKALGADGPAATSPDATPATSPAERRRLGLPPGPDQPG